MRDERPAVFVTAARCRSTGRDRLRDRAADERGFTLVEMTIATAIAMLVIAMALMAVVEGQRTVDTAVAKTQDANAAQSVVDRIATQVRQASALGIVTNDSESQLWVSSGTACTEWVFTGSPSDELESGSGASRSTIGDLGVQLTGVTSGSFTGFANYAGLVDISLSVEQQQVSTGNGRLDAGAPAALELEVDDPDVSTAVASTYPAGSCAS